MNNEDLARHGRRLLDFLATGEATRESTPSGKVMLHGRRGVVAIPGGVLADAICAGLVALEDDRVRLTEAGRDARRQPIDRFQAQHRVLEEVAVETMTGWETVTVNLAESPLAQLARRRGRDGRAYLDERELRAGERLRSDFTRGQLTPRLGASWQALGSSGRRGKGGAGGTVDLTDTALAARQRVDRAIDATGPELSGVLLDVCCFLKGLAQVEAERNWPVRSAKLMLKAALGSLARHYEPQRATNGAPRGFHWGAENYRPTIR